MTSVTLGFPIMLDVLQGSVSNQKTAAINLEEDNVIGNLLNLTGFRKHSHC